MAKFVPPTQKTANYNPKFERSLVMGDDILQLLDDADLKAVDEILAGNKGLLDYEGDNCDILEKVEEIPSIAKIVNSIGIKKVLQMDDEDRSLLFPDPVGYAKWCEENPEDAKDTSESAMSIEIRKNFKELNIVGNGI